MSSHQASVPGMAASRGAAPALYVRRVARFIVLRAALRGRISWPVALLMLAKIGGAA